jgi:hypothetical protein
MINSVPAKKAVKAQPHAFTWNIGTMSKHRSLSQSPMEFDVVEASECNQIERCE